MTIRCEGMRYSTVCQSPCTALHYSTLHVFGSYLYCPSCPSMTWPEMTWPEMTWHDYTTWCDFEFNCLPESLHCTARALHCTAQYLTVPCPSWPVMKWHDYTTCAMCRSTVSQSHCTALHVYFTVLHCTVFDSTVSILICMTNPDMTYSDMTIRCEGMRHSTVCQNNCTVMHCTSLHLTALHGVWQYDMTWTDYTTWCEMM